MEKTPKVTDTRCPHKNCKTRDFKHSALCDVSSRLHTSLGIVHLRCESNSNHQWAFKLTKEEK
jgi:hypothetical protein